MSKIILVTGGARSGKSGFAERLAESYPAQRGYVATAEARDGEMEARIARHRQRRGGEWQTIEEPLELADAIVQNQGRYGVLLVDCLTLWLSNLLFHLDGDSAAILSRVRALVEGFADLSTPLIIVTNEVGMGIVPEHPLSRAFRDLAGEANQIVAAGADEVYVSISGIPLRLK